MKTNSSAPHTESPWAVLDRSEGKGNNLVIRADNCGDERAVCEVVNEPWHSTQEVEANARLIAAAPELLVGVRALIAMIARDKSHTLKTPEDAAAFRAALAAITKATSASL